MFRFFIKSAIEDPQHIVITDKETVNKITKVLRFGIGDVFVILDNTGEEYEVRIQEIKNKQVLCTLVSRLNIDRELPVEINLYQSLLKKDKLEWLCQKVTEIGVKRIIPVISENCVVKELNLNKTSRYKKIIEEATIQSGGKIPPKFESVVQFENAIKNLHPRALNLICHEEEQDLLLAEVLAKNSEKIINLFIGPEGGFSQFEIDLARQNSLVLVSLGKRILRAETAAVISSGLCASI
ncbi:MAG: RsmE family RNA methyltransferase [Candidatus Parcubacteria bacterium]|nr:RsmE family RNA methyltransferase [Candidatus Parcubacteria bacterium]